MKLLMVPMDDPRLFPHCWIYICGWHKKKTTHYKSVGPPKFIWCLWRDTVILSWCVICTPDPLYYPL